MLIEAAEWWIGQMRGLLPPGILPTMVPDARIIAIDRLDVAAGQKPEGTVLLRRKGLETAVAPLDLDYQMPAAPSGLATGLRLPRDHVLRREVVLPLAAARNVKAVIGFEMDRLTPFSTDELFWGISGVKQDRLHGRIRLNLFFMLRAQVENLLAALRRASMAPSFIEIGGGLAEYGLAGHGRIDLDPDHRRAARWVRIALAAACGVLILGNVTSPFLRQQMALNATAQQISALAPAAQTAQNLRHQLEINASGQAAIAAARRSGDVLQVLASLTSALPDGTWLTDLTFKSGELSVDGRSTDAAALIGLLSAVPGLEDPGFTAPVTRAADGSADQFSLSATVRQ